MEDLAKVLDDLIRPIVSDPDHLKVETVSSDDDREIVLKVTASNDDIAKLIGRKGSMASALRQVMSVASHSEGRRVSIKFEQI